MLRLRLAVGLTFNYRSVAFSDATVEVYEPMQDLRHSNRRQAEMILRLTSAQTNGSP